MSQDEHASVPEPANPQGQSRQIKHNMKASSTWVRLFFMIVVVMLAAVSRVVVGVVVVLQFFFVLFTAESNKKLEGLGQSLATYTYQIIRYLTFNTEERPYPFDADWPKGPPES